MNQNLNGIVEGSDVPDDDSLLDQAYRQFLRDHPQWESSCMPSNAAHQDAWQRWLAEQPKRAEEALREAKDAVRKAFEPFLDGGLLGAVPAAEVERIIALATGDEPDNE